ncbi:MAG: HupE/UreJ family protein [Gemmatimonadetes bacterium]|nr:HupE/UreJ family protein [Gemmatimonadota bacterium]
MRWWTFLALALAATPLAQSAHEIPADVTIRAFAAPAGDWMRILVRVPVTSMRDVVFPVYGPGYVDIAGATALLPDQAKIWIADYLTVYEDGVPLPPPTVTNTRISLPSDPSFATFVSALGHFSDPPIGPGVDLVLEQAVMDVLLTVPISDEEARFSLDARWAHLGLQTSTVLRFVPATGAERVFQYEGDPGRVRLDPRWHQAFLSFVKLGFVHILEGLDHLLFLLCLVVPVRRLWPVVSVVTGFTVAHSITLVAAATGLAPTGLWFPPLIETLIAASIVYMALENIIGGGLERRWAWAFGFGLVHGFGFSFVLAETLQFAGQHLLASLFAFNVGVELGQLLVVALSVPALTFLLHRLPSERVGVVIVSALVAHTGWHWMVDRGSRFLAYDIRVPTFDGAFAAVLLDWLLLGLIAVSAAWALHLVFTRLARGGPGGQDRASTVGSALDGSPSAADGAAGAG